MQSGSLVDISLTAAAFSLSFSVNMHPKDGVILYDSLIVARHGFGNEVGCKQSGLPPTTPHSITHPASVSYTSCRTLEPDLHST